LLAGWLSPQYVAQLNAPELQEFLAEQPLLAALTMQAFWLAMLLYPDGSAARRSAEDRACRRFLGPEAREAWKFAVPITAMLAGVHATWYASFSRTNVAMNTLLWNTDLLTTPLLAALIGRQPVSRATLTGGTISLCGVGLAVGSGGAGNTALGCILCFAASMGYALYVVVIEHKVDPMRVPITDLIGMVGVLSLVALGTAVLARTAWEHGYLAALLGSLPPWPWIAFMGFNGLLLNMGWLTCTAIVGSFWAAMVACLSLPLSMLLDWALLDRPFSTQAVLGVLLIVVGVVAQSMLAVEESCLEGQGDAANAVPSLGPIRRLTSWIQARQPQLPLTHCAQTELAACGGAALVSAAGATLKSFVSRTGSTLASPRGTVAA